MGKRKTQKSISNDAMPAPTRAHAFTFGEPEPIDRAALLDYVQVIQAKMLGLNSILGIQAFCFKALDLAA